MTLHVAQDPMTGFKTLEQAFATGWRMTRVPFTSDVFYEKDMALGAERFTYAKLNKLKVQQLALLTKSRTTTGKYQAQDP